jgi:hypothetical protein
VTPQRQCDLRAILVAIAHATKVDDGPKILELTDGFERMLDAWIEQDILVAIMPYAVVKTENNEINLDENSRGN